MATIGVAAALLACVVVCPPPSRAQTEVVPPILEGAWTLEPSRSIAMSTVIAAFQPTIDRLPSMLHNYARGRLREAMQPPHRAQVTLDGSEVHLRLESDDVTTVDGTLGRRARATGVEPGTVVSTRLRGGWLEVRYFGEDTEMLQLFSTEQDGSRMHLDHSLTGPQVVGTVRYRLDYVPR